MIGSKYVYGYDFGTLSCRLVMVSLSDGSIIAEAEMEYPNGVISQCLPGTNITLDSGWYLQDPRDYIFTLTELSKKILEKTGVNPSDILAIGTAFTNCTMMPLDKEGNVLCMQEKYKDNPHSWVKLWKHHSAEIYAKEIELYAKEHLPRLKYYGNNVSSEWLFPKILQIAREDKGIFDAADTFIEAADWIVYKLCGKLVRCSAILGVNAFYDVDEGGYPPMEFFYGIDQTIANVVHEKLKGQVKKVGECAGVLTNEMAAAMGLTPGTVVAVGHGDSEVAACGTGVAEAGNMILVIGTSTCHQMMAQNKTAFEGVCAIVKDGMIPGMYAYESGQPAVGDIFEWYANNLAPETYKREAEERGIPLLKLMDIKSGQLKAGQSGLVALDWFNGNRSILMNYDLTGLIMGLTLHSKPEEIYRALVEATAFGTKVILNTYEANNMKINAVTAAGGLPQKSPFVAQLYADVLKREIKVPLIKNITSLGAAVCASVAVGSDNGGFDSFYEATQKLVPKEAIVFKPNNDNAKVYDRLFGVYKALHDYFGVEHSSLMKELSNIQQSID